MCQTRSDHPTNRPMIAYKTEARSFAEAQRTATSSSRARTTSALSAPKFQTHSSSHHRKNPHQTRPRRYPLIELISIPFYLPLRRPFPLHHSPKLNQTAPFSKWPPLFRCRPLHKNDSEPNRRSLFHSGKQIHCRRPHQQIQPRCVCVAPISPTE